MYQAYLLSQFLSLHGLDQAFSWFLLGSGWEVIEVVEEEPGQVDLNHSSGSEAESAGPLFVDSSDAASKCSTIDSIARNADFVAFS